MNIGLHLLLALNDRILFLFDVRRAHTELFFLKVPVVNCPPFSVVPR